jgi:hypothetical protein
MLLSALMLLGMAGRPTERRIGVAWVRIENTPCSVMGGPINMIEPWQSPYSPEYEGPPVFAFVQAYQPIAYTVCARGNLDHVLVQWSKLDAGFWRGTTSMYDPETASSYCNGVLRWHVEDVGLPPGVYMCRARCVYHGRRGMARTLIVVALP